MLYLAFNYFSWNPNLCWKVWPNSQLYNYSKLLFQHYALVISQILDPLNCWLSMSLSSINCNESWVNILYYSLKLTNIRQLLNLDLVYICILFVSVLLGDSSSLLVFTWLLGLATMKLREFWVPVICNLFLWRVYQPPRQKGVPSGAPLILRPQRGRWIASIVFL